jgi:hypothetical protein
VSPSPEQQQRRAARLLRCYPTIWRDRYGEEFTALLLAAFADQPRSWRRTVDVARSGVLARLTNLGLTSQALEPSAQIQASVATLGCVVSLFLAFAIAIWSQLAIGWQWSRPDTQPTTVAMFAMSAVMLIFLVLGLLAALPIMWAVLTRILRGQAARLRGPSLLFLLGSVALVVGSLHFAQHGWPGAGGHPWVGRGLVSGAVGSVAWAATLSISAYWAHPVALLSFPASEVVWMAVSPIAIICTVVGATKSVRRLELSPRLLRYEARLGSAAAAAMIAFLAAACLWIIDGGAGPRNLFRTGAIDIVGLLVMSIAFAAAHVAMRNARAAQHALPASH